MVEQVNRNIKQRASGLLMALVGTGLPGRIRSTVIAMLGMTTAAGLALILFLVQTSWPIPSLGPLALPRPSQAAIEGEVSLGGGGSTGSGAPGSGPGRGVAGSFLVVAAPFGAVEGSPGSTGPNTGLGAPGGDHAGLAPGIGESKGAAGGSQTATPSPANPVRGSNDAPGSATAPEFESAPVSVPTSQPAPAPETPAVPTGEEVPIGGELPEEPPFEEPPMEEPPVEEPAPEEPPAEEPAGEEPTTEEPPAEEAEAGGGIEEEAPQP
jgi:hypothetical protein